MVYTEVSYLDSEASLAVFNKYHMRSTPVNYRTETLVRPLSNPNQVNAKKYTTQNAPHA